MDCIHIHPILSSWPWGIKRDLCCYCPKILYLLEFYDPSDHKTLVLLEQELWSHNSCPSRTKAVRDAWLIGNLVCLWHSWSFSKCLQFGPLKGHSRDYIWDHTFLSVLEMKMILVCLPCFLKDFWSCSNFCCRLLGLET